MNDEEILRLHANNMTFEEIMILIGMESNAKRRQELILYLLNLFEEKAS